MGNGHTFHQRSPMRILALDDKAIKMVACGASWCFAISSSGELYGWGHADGGWLGVDVLAPPPSLRYSDADEPSAAQPVPHSLPHSDLTYTYSFESRVNILTPTLIESYRESSVRYVRCGTDFSIVSSIALANKTESRMATLTSQKSQLPEEVVRHCRLGRKEALVDYLRQAYRRDNLDLETKDECGVSDHVFATHL